VVKEYTENINIDLMQDISEDYTVDTIGKDIKWFLSHKLPSLTIYITRFNPGSKGYQRLLNPKPDLKHTLKSVATRIAVSDILLAEGYQYAPGGRFIKSRIHDIYKAARSSHVEKLLGIGPSAYSRLGIHFFKNKSDIHDWLKDIDDEISDGMQHHYIIDSEIWENNLMNLIRSGGLITDFKECLNNTSHKSAHQITTEYLLNIGMLKEETNRYELTQLGRALEEEILLKFYSEYNLDSLKEVYA
jgi:coproporphyrinogen III oxidase-like Fe-S oxidoreductase